MGLLGGGRFSTPRSIERAVRICRIRLSEKTSPKRSPRPTACDRPSDPLNFRKPAWEFISPQSPIFPFGFPVRSLSFSFASALSTRPPPSAGLPASIVLRPSSAIPRQPRPGLSRVFPGFDPYRPITGWELPVFCVWSTLACRPCANTPGRFLMEFCSPPSIRIKLRPSPKPGSGRLLHFSFFFPRPCSAYHSRTGGNETRQRRPCTLAKNGVPPSDSCTRGLFKQSRLPHCCSELLLNNPGCSEPVSPGGFLTPPTLWTRQPSRRTRVTRFISAQVNKNEVQSIRELPVTDYYPVPSLPAGGIRVVLSWWKFPFEARTGP